MKSHTSTGSVERRFLAPAALGAAGAAICAAAAVITLSESQSSNPGLEAELRTALIAIPIAAGIYAWNRDPWTKFAKLLVISGVAWALTTLAESSNDVLYSTGRVFGWFVEPLLIFMVLAFPSGRLKTKPARRLVAASVAVLAVLYLPTALLVNGYPTPSPVSSCHANCPPNAFMLAGTEPGFVGQVIVPLRELATMIVLAGVAAVLATRIKRATALMRITLVPVLTIAIVHALAVIGAVVARRISADAPVTDALLTVVVISYAGVAVGFLAGLSGWRLFENRALRRLVAGLASHPPALSLRETSELLSESMDPSMEVFHNPPEAGVWLDAEQREVHPPSAGHNRSVTGVSAVDGHVVAIAHDTALKDSPTLVAVARSSVLKALENERLGTELRESLRSLSESRARIMSNADRERQRIERDLHDGAQQSLVALRIRLDLAAQLLSQDPSRAERLLSELATEVDATLDEVRSLARGVYPSLLTDRGLSGALRAAALRSPVPTIVHTEAVKRYRPDIETATYFCCLEAMQNAMKHADAVGKISVTLAAVNGDLRFEVRDDGMGFALDDVTPGAGLTSMRDRLSALGGVLAIRTAPGAGTCVSGRVPLNGNGSRPIEPASPLLTGAGR